MAEFSLGAKVLIRMEGIGAAPPQDKLGRLAYVMQIHPEKQVDGQPHQNYRIRIKEPYTFEEILEFDVDESWLELV